MPPMVLGKIEFQKGQKRIEGLLIGLPDTPDVMMSHPPEHTYRKLERAARVGENWGAGIFGLGAYTSVIGDAGVTLARRVQIGVTTGNSLTVFAVVETLRRVSAGFGRPLSSVSVGVVGATGSIGSACCRLLASEVHCLYLIAPRLEKLNTLKEEILKNHPRMTLQGYTRLEDAPVSEIDVLIFATSSRGNALDIRRVKSGAILLDVALPHDVTDEMLKLRSDVYVLDAGEMRLPGAFHSTFPLPLPDGVVYACLAETMLLALENIYQDYSLGRDIHPQRVQQIASLATRYGFEPALLPRPGSLPLPFPSDSTFHLPPVPHAPLPTK